MPRPQWPDSTNSVSDDPGTVQSWGSIMIVLDQSEFSQRLQDAILQLTLVEPALRAGLGENIAAGQSTPQSVVSCWWQL